MTTNNSPYTVHVYDLIRHPGAMREQRVSIPVTEKLGEGLLSVPEGETIDLDLPLESMHDGILVTGEVDSTYRGECGRCLNPIEAPVEVEFQELFAYPGEEANDFEVQDDHVDLETLVRDAVVLSLPFQPVCQPDCPGLDPETGERLTGSAGKEQVAPVDPRWAALQQITDHGNAAE